VKKNGESDARDIQVVGTANQQENSIVNVCREAGEIMIPFQFHRHIPLIRRPFYQRDEAIRQRNAAEEELTRVTTERNQALADREALAAERNILPQDGSRAPYWLRRGYVEEIFMA
jgi:hypothetical protein